jgi:DNA-binding CsgD family transcriptional regulator/predicted negative regulator of RcsB-dependent stress response
MTVSLNKPVVCPVLIGRTPDLALLQLSLEQVKSGKGQVALLCGEAGIGKSRLVAELKTEAFAQGFQLLQGNCFPTDRSCPYAPLLDLLRSIFLTSSTAQVEALVRPFAREFAPLLPDVIHLFPDLTVLPPLPSLDPEQEKRRLFAALAHFFLSQAAERPLLLVVEDLHWSDDTSLEFLQYVARCCAIQPLLVLLTYRSDEVRPALSHWLAELDREHLGQEVALTRLTHSETGAMLRAIFALDRPAHAEFLDAIYNLTEGNPFFIEEILKSLIASGETFSTDGTWKPKLRADLHIPRSIQDAVHQRSDQLSESARQVSILAAVAGRRFDFVLLQQVTHHDEQQLLTLMKELMSAQLVVEESAEQFAFRHALTRQAIYTELLVRERKALHHTIAETMEYLYAGTLEAHLADLAYHFSEAGLWEKALSYAQQAGERAQRLYASRAAIEQFTRALDAARELPLAPPAALYHARGQAYETLGDFEQARHDYEQALEAAHEAHDDVAEWQSLLDLGFLWAGRDYQQTGAYFRRALERARMQASPKLLAHSLNRLGNWHANVEQLLEALRCHQEALTIFQEAQDQHGVAETLDLLAVPSWFIGDLVQTAAYCRQAVALFREMDNRQGLVSSLASLLLCGDTYFSTTLVPVATSVTEVRRVGERTLSLAREIDQRSGEAYTCSCMAICLGSRGEYAYALELAQDGLRIAEEIEHRQWMAAEHWALGALYLDLLELTMACQHLEQALALAQEIGSLYWIHNASALLASVCSGRGDLARAEALLTAALASDAPPQTLAQRLIWYARAQLALAQGKPDRTLAITEQLFASAAHVAGEQSIPHLAHLRGEAFAMLNRPAEAETALQAAQAGAVTRGLRPLLWRIAIDLGNLYQAQRRDEEAEHARAFAQELIEDLAAPITDTALRAHFLQQATALLPHQEPLSPRRAAKRAFGGLTEREREVAVLIAQGKANREIAEILVVSSRTIEKHIENILSKLGFTSRAQIAVWATEKGLGKKEQGQL